MNTIKEVSFREKYEWAINHLELPGFCIEPAEIERLYAEAHPSRVTAEDVWDGLRPHGWARLHVQEPCIRKLCAEVADLRNAAREDEDEEWIDKALTRLVNNGFVLNYDTVKQDVRTVIRAAYRARKGS